VAGGVHQREAAVELALQANASHPLVRPTLERVTERRLAFLTQLYTDVGSPKARAADRALLAPRRLADPDVVDSPVGHDDR
jgi:hypothetical protein